MLRSTWSRLKTNSNVNEEIELGKSSRMAGNKQTEKGCTRCGTFRSAWVVPRKKVEQEEEAQWIAKIGTRLPCVFLWPLTGLGEPAPRRAAADDPCISLGQQEEKKLP